MDDNVLMAIITAGVIFLICVLLWLAFGTEITIRFLFLSIRPVLGFLFGFSVGRMSKCNKNSDKNKKI